MSSNHWFHSDHNTPAGRLQYTNRIKERKMEENESFINKFGHSKNCSCDLCKEYWSKHKLSNEHTRLGGPNSYGAKIIKERIDKERQDKEQRKAAIAELLAYRKRLNIEEPADMINHPPHYTTHPSGVEAIQITEHESFCIGSAFKYLFRAGKKGSRLQDLQKAAWYINREIERLSK